MTIKRKIDLKHAITDDGQLIKYKDDTIVQVVPDDEPLVLFRGRDRLAVTLLERYKYFCVQAGCNDFQLAQIDALIERFKKFAKDNPQTMKQPGVTRGL